MTELSAEVRQRLLGQRRKLQERANSGRRGAAYVSLTGKKAIVQPGQGILLRLLPRWDYASKFRKNPKTGKVEVDPGYKEAEAFVVGFEHWWDRDGRTFRALCRKTLGEEEACPLCDVATALMEGGKPEEVKDGQRMQAHDVYLFNVVLRKKMYKEDGTPDIRILPVGWSVWDGIVKYMVGDEEGDQFVRGDITDPFEGYDIKISRPQGPAERYKVDCAPKPTRLFPKEEAAKWQGWTGMLHDLVAEVNPPNVPTFVEAYRLYWGHDPEGEESSPPAPSGDVPESPSFEDSPAAPESGLDDFNFDLPGEPAPAPAAPPKRR